MGVHQGAHCEHKQSAAGGYAGGTFSVGSQPRVSREGRPGPLHHGLTVVISASPVTRHSFTPHELTLHRHKSGACFGRRRRSMVGEE